MKNKINDILIVIIVALLVIIAFLSYKYYDSNKKVTVLNNQISDLNTNISNLKEALENANEEENSYIIPLTYDELTNHLDNHSTFPLLVTQATCGNCVRFKPVLNKVLSDHNLITYEIDLLSLSTEEYNSFLEKFRVTGTPTLIFVEEGTEKSLSNRIVGNVPEKQVVEKFKELNYIH